MPGSILWQNASRTITLLDIPRSIEEVAAPAGELTIGSLTPSYRLVSSAAPQIAYASTEPKSTRAVRALPDEDVETLLLQRHLHFALREVREGLGISESGLPGAGELGAVENLANCGVSGRPQECRSRGGSLWCLSRVLTAVSEDSTCSRPKRRRSDDNDTAMSEKKVDSYDILGSITDRGTLLTSKDLEQMHNIIVPVDSTCLHGRIQTTMPTFRSYAPSFDALIMDPPWPNRSVRRGSKYVVGNDTGTTYSLIKSLPVNSHLKDGGLLGVWITNRRAFREMVLGGGKEEGLFQMWNIHLLEEWVWLKVAANGEPVTALNGRWRKPYEILLLGRKRGANCDKAHTKTGDVDRKVIVAVPDLHSRKPNLCRLLESMMPAGYRGLEIFARNLTAGWWSWGDEALKFQGKECWSTRDLQHVVDD